MIFLELKQRLTGTVADEILHQVDRSVANAYLRNNVTLYHIHDIIQEQARDVIKDTIKDF